jgi:serine/threonine protein kinase
MVMEFLDGMTLKHGAAGKPLEMEQVLSPGLKSQMLWMRRIVKALSIATSSPANIFVTKRRHGKVLDFGQAKLTARSAALALADTETVAKEPERPTRERAIVGTAGYMSPEQIRSKELDARTDLFSFGAVLYEMATAKLPFEGANSVQLCAVIFRDEPRPPSKLNPAVSPELAAVMHKALEKDRNLR